MLTGLKQLYLSHSFFPEVCPAQEAPDLSGLCIACSACLQILIHGKMLFMTS